VAILGAAILASLLLQPKAGAGSAAHAAPTFVSMLEGLCSGESATRQAAAGELFRLGRISADRVARIWRNDAEFAALLGEPPLVTVGVAVRPETFAKIRAANGTPRLAEVPPDQDALEFELKFQEKISLDILTSRTPDGNGPIARYLKKFGEGVQQVEFLCKNVDRATTILREKFGVTAVYPATRAGADGTPVNFFLVPASDTEKVLVELYEAAP
jgi:hypothetical protein